MFKSIYSLPVFVLLAATMQIASEPIDEKAPDTSKHLQEADTQEHPLKSDSDANNELIKTPKDLSHEDSDLVDEDTEDTLQEPESPEKKSSNLSWGDSPVYQASQDDDLIEPANQVEKTIPPVELPAAIAHQENSIALKYPATTVMDKNINNAIIDGNYQQLLEYEKKKEIDQERVFEGLLYMIRNIQPRAAASKIFHNQFIPYCKKNKLLGHLDSLDDKTIEELQKHAIQSKDDAMFKNTLEVNNFVSEKTVAYLEKATENHCSNQYQNFPDRKKACNACNKIATMIDEFGKRENKES